MKKLRTKFLLYILMPVVLIITLTGIVSLFVAYRIVFAQLRELGELAIQQAVDEIDTTLGTGLETLHILAIHEGMANLPANQLRTIFGELREKVGADRKLPIESIFLGLLDGRFVTSADPSMVPPDYEPRFQPWFISALDSDEAVVTPPYLSPFSWQLVVTVAHKVTDRKGTVVGVLGYGVPLTAFRQKIPKIKVVEQIGETVFSLFLRDGRYLMHTSEDKIGRKLGESSEDLHVRMRQALGEDRTTWCSVGTIDGTSWFGAFQKSRYTDLYVGLEIPLTAALKPMYDLWGAYLALGFAALLALSVILVTMAHKIARPVNMLSAAAKRLRRGDYGDALPVITRDELGRLIEAFNSMAEGLKQRDFIRDTFGRYVPQEVVDRLLEAEDGLLLGGESREISMLMSDLRGFTALTAQMPPEKVLYLLNRYLARMVEILLDHKAIVDEIEGDGILAFFGAPEPMEDHPARAVACALAMEAAMDQINHLNQTDGLPRLEMGIGINTGTVIVGNIGSERRTKYGAVGSEVNFTGRIESYALGGQILISEATYACIEDITKIRDVISVEMKGIPGPVNLYDVGGLAAPYNVELPDLTETPRPIKIPLPVQIRRVDNKVVAPIGNPGRLTHLSETSALVDSEVDLGPHQEIRIDILDYSRQYTQGEAFGKVMTAESSEHGFQASLRFTFVSPEIRRILRAQLYGAVTVSAPLQKPNVTKKA